MLHRDPRDRVSLTSQRSDAEPTSVAAWTLSGHRAQRPVVSVIINNHNYARFLRDAIESALNQTWPATEVVVVDDGSTDDSSAVIDSYTGRILAVSQPNRGQGAAINSGFASSSGELVIFLDADDRLLPQACERAVDAWSRNPRASKIQYRMEVIDANGAPTGVHKPPPHARLPSGDLRRHYLTFPDDVWRMPTSGNAFPARVLEQISPIPEDDYRAGADTYLTHLAPLFGPVVSGDWVGASYRVHGANQYELSEPALNLDRIRRNISHAAKTRRHIMARADDLGLATIGPRRRIESVSFLMNRIISLKLDPSRHPIATDRLLILFAAGVRAAYRRFDVAWPMRLMYAAWFAAMTVAPRRSAWMMAELMVFSDRRRFLDGWLRRFARPPGRRGY